MVRLVDGGIRQAGVEVVGVDPVAGDEDRGLGTAMVALQVEHIEVVAVLVGSSRVAFAVLLVREGAAHVDGGRGEDPGGGRGEVSH